jgi:prophage regulatory protein
MPQGAPRGKRFIRLPEVREITSLSTSTIYDAVKNGTFPAPVPLFAGLKVKKSAVAWVESEVHDWMDSRTAARDEARTPPKAGKEPEPPTPAIEDGSAAEAKPPALSHKQRVLQGLARKAASKRAVKPKSKSVRLVPADRASEVA